MVLSQDFLIESYKDFKTSMQWHSDIEYKLLNMYMVLYPVVATILLAIYGLVDKTTYLGIISAMMIILTILTFFIDRKIRAEHKTYEAIGQQIVRIWTYFDLFTRGTYLPNEAILSEDARRFGTGDGYKKTLNIFWAITIITDIILLHSGILHYIFA
jgi:hypothetical protein